MFTFVKVATVSEVTEGSAHAVELKGKQLAVARYQGQFYVFDNICTHALALLSEGFLEGKEIECPLHGARFDITTGKVLCAPAFADIKSYEVEVEGEDIKVKLG